MRRSLPTLALAVVLVSTCARSLAAEPARALEGAEVRSASKVQELDRDAAGRIEREVLRTRVEATAGRPEGDPELWLTLRYDDGVVERFTVHRKNRLYDETRGLTYRFYMAYLLAEDLAGAGQAAKGPPAAAPAAPAAPAKVTPPPAPEVPVEVILQAMSSMSVALDAKDRLELALELRRAGSFSTPNGGLVGAPDLTLIVRYADGREERHALYGRGAVLHDEGADRTCQFYMGVYLYDLLAAAMSGQRR